MTWSVMSDVPNPLFDANGDPYSGAVLKAYLPGTTTSTSIAIAAAGTSPQTTITANAEGKWEVSGNEILPYIDRTHKWGIFADATNATANTPFYMGPFDNVGKTLEGTQANLSFATVAAMVASDAISVGDTIQTSGYTAEGDGGDNLYEVVAAATGTDDGGSYIDLATHQAKGLFPRGVHNIKQWGAIGDGATNDNAEVTSAIAYGKSLHIPDGDFLVDGTAFAPVAGQSISGNGYNSNFVKEGNVTFFTEDFFQVTNSDVSITSVRFTKSINAVQLAVSVEGADNFILNDCFFIGVQLWSVFVWKNTTDVSIQRNYMDCAAGPATGGDRTGNVDGPVSRVNISNNFILNTELEGIDVNWDTHDSIIHGNIFYNCNTNESGEIIDIGGGAGANRCDNIAVTSNFIDLTTLDSNSGIRLKDNPALDGNQSANINISNNTIKRDSMPSSTTIIGILVKSGSNIVVHGNVIENMLSGIAISNPTECRDIVVSDNNVRNCKERCILVTGTAHENISITGNVLNHSNVLSTSDCINIAGVTDISISSNILTGAGTSGGAVNGLQVGTNCVSVVVQGNTFTDFGNSGINMDASTEPVLIDGNTISGCEINGISMGSGQEWTKITNNQVYNNAVSGAGTAIVGVAPLKALISGNMIFDTRAGASRTQVDGIDVGAGDRCIITDNIINNITGSAIQESLTNSVVSDNVIA